MNNLRAAGYRPEQVDEIYITHLGPDHVGGLTVGTERAFPNAWLRTPKAEVDFFLDPVKAASTLSKTPDKDRPQAKSYFDFLRSLFEPYISAGKFQSFDGDITLVPGVHALATHGHTPGHTSYIVENRGQTLIVIGDVVIMGALQFATPSLGSSADADPKAAAEQRLRIFKMAADNDYWLAGGHISFPGIGHVRFRQDRYWWSPANYTIP